MVRLLGPGAIFAESVAKRGLLFMRKLIPGSAFLASRVLIEHQFVLEGESSGMRGSPKLPREVVEALHALISRLVLL